MLKASICRGTAYEHFCLIYTFRGLLAPFVREKRVVGNLEEPRAELSLVPIACTRQVSLHKSVLRQVVCLVLVAAAKREQEASDSFLLQLHVGYEILPTHELSLFNQLFFFCFNFLRQHLLAYHVVDKEGYTDGKQDSANGIKHEKITNGNSPMPVHP